MNVHGVLGPQDLLNKYPQVIEKLKNSTYSRGLNMELLQAASAQAIYSFRLNKKDRLLVTNVVIDGLLYYVVLDAMLDHKYNRSPLLKKGSLKAHLTRCLPDYMDQIRATPSAAASTAAESTQEQTIVAEKPPLVELEYHHDQYMIFNGPQAQARNTRERPLVVTGMPGSGKSCVAMSCLKQYLEETRADGARPRVLYVTASPRLAQSMRDSWINSPECSPEDADAIEFKSYADLILEQDTAIISALTGKERAELYAELKSEAPEAESDSFVGEAACTAWFNSLNSPTNTTLKEQLAACLTPNSDLANALYQEFRLISGFVPVEEYPQYSKGNSLFSESGLRAQLLRLYAEYQIHLGTSRKVDLAFYKVQAAGIYDRVIADEGQDFSTQELANLNQLSQGNDVVYFLDTNQSLFDPFSKIPWLKAFYYRNRVNLNVLHLSASIRCPEMIVQAANAVLELGNHYAGGVPDKDTDPQMKADEHASKGHVVWLEPDDARLADLRIASAERVIITHPDYIDEARDKFPGSIVLTPGQVKGLEFEEVVLYRLLDHTNYKRINKKLAKLNLEPGQSMGRAQHGEAKRDEARFFNELFTAITRCENKLIFVDRRDHDIRCFDKALHRVINPALSSGTPAVAAAVAAAGPAVAKSNNDSREQWLVAIQKLVASGTIDEARRMSTLHLQISGIDFDRRFMPDILKATKKGTDLAKVQCAQVLLDLSQAEEVLPRDQQELVRLEVESKKSRLKLSEEENQLLEKCLMGILALSDSALFQSEVKKLIKEHGAARIMLKTQLLGGRSFLTQLIRNHQAGSTQAFPRTRLLLVGEIYVMLINNDVMQLMALYLSAETIEEQRAVLYFFAFFPSGIEYIANNILTKPSEVFLELLTKPVGMPDVTVLKMLTACWDGINLCASFMDASPFLAEQLLQADTLWSYNNNAVLTLKQSAITALFFHFNGLNLLDRLLTNPALMPTSPGVLEELLSLNRYFVADRGNVFPWDLFSALCVLRTGNAILKKFMDHFGERVVASCIKESSIKKIVTEKAVHSTELVFDLLIDKPMGLDLFCSWLRSNPAILLTMSLSTDGHAAFLRLLKKDVKKVAASIDRETLFSTKQVTHPTYWNLLTSEKGVQCLVLLFQENKTLLAVVTEMSLGSSRESYMEILPKLETSKAGRALISLIGKPCDEIVVATAPNLEDECHLFRINLAINLPSLMMDYARNAEGHQKLLRAVKGEYDLRGVPLNFAEQITPEMLFNEAVFTPLCFSPDGIEFLSILFDKNQSLLRLAAREKFEWAQDPRLRQSEEGRTLFRKIAVIRATASGALFAGSAASAAPTPSSVEQPGFK